MKDLSAMLDILMLNLETMTKYLFFLAKFVFQLCKVTWRETIMTCGDVI